MQPTHHFYAHFFRGENRLVNGQQCTAPLGVELTGFRLLTSIVILIGVPMAVYSYDGHALVSTTLDLLGGQSLPSCKLLFCGVNVVSRVSY